LYGAAGGAFGVEGRLRRTAGLRPERPGLPRKRPSARSAAVRERERAALGGEAAAYNGSVRPRFKLWEYLVIVPVLTALLVLSILGAWWAGRHGWAIDRLTRGVGDTVFYTADGRPWFPMDEQRRDVSIDQISPHLRNAVIAVEDHRFRYHPGVDPVGLSRAVVENLRAGGRITDRHEQEGSLVMWPFE